MKSFTFAWSPLDCFSAYAHAAFADEENDRQGVWRAVVRQTARPIRREKLCVLHDCIHVARERERNDVRPQAIDDCARLLAGAAVRLPDLDVLAGFRFPMPGKGGVVFDVKLAGGVVGDIEQVLRAGGRNRSESEEEKCVDWFHGWSCGCLRSHAGRAVLGLASLVWVSGPRGFLGLRLRGTGGC